MLLPVGHMNPSVDPLHLESFKVGVLFACTRNLRKDPLWPVGYKNHELPYISAVSYPHEVIVVTANSTLMIYMGQIRVEESMTKTGVTTSFPRHVFLVGNMRYMVKDLNILYRAQDRSFTF